MFSIKLMRNFCRYYSTPAVFIKSDTNFLKPIAVNLLYKVSIHREVNETAQAKLRAEDNLPDSYQLIYRAPLNTFVKVSYFTAFTSLAAVIPLLGTSLYLNDFTNFPAMINDTVIVNSLNEFYAIIASLAIVTINVGGVVSRYPFRIYKDNESRKYVAVYQNIIPWSTKNEEFFAGELYKYGKGLMPWKESLYAFRNRKALIMYGHLRRPSDLDDMLKKDC